MDLKHVIARRFEPTHQSWDWRDAALYALGLGMGDDPIDEDELAYVFEGRDQRAAPGMGVMLGWPPPLRALSVRFISPAFPRGQDQDRDVSAGRCDPLQGVGSGTPSAGARSGPMQPGKRVAKLLALKISEGAWRS